jgi:hypothetical protein
MYAYVGDLRGRRLATWRNVGYDAYAAGYAAGSQREQQRLL